MLKIKKGFCLFVMLVFTSYYVHPQSSLPPERKSAAINFEDARRLAIASSSELKSARATRALREGVWKLGLRAYLPQISFAVSEDDRLSLTSSDSFLKNYTVSLDQLLWDGGRTSSARILERSELSLLGDELRRSEGEIAEAAINAYRKVLMDRQIIAIREDALESLVEQRRILAKELSLGMVTSLDLEAGEITVQQADLELALLRLNAEETERAFAELLGLDELPELSESIDIHRSAAIPSADGIKSIALSRNPELASSRHLLMRRQSEVKQASLLYLPTFRATGDFTVSGQHYPLSHYKWSLGLTVNFSTPWFSASGGGSAGWEPPNDRSARIQNSFSPAPDPAAGLGAKQAELALAFEEENYSAAIEKTGRTAILGIEKISLSEKRRNTALDELELAEKKFRLTTVLMDLGRVTRVELMEARIEFAEAETRAAEAAAALLASERELEKFLDLKPGTLLEFCNRFGGKK